MELIIGGTPEEIAALVLAVQERRMIQVSSQPMNEKSRAELSNQIREVLLAQAKETVSEEIQPQQPDSTERKLRPIEGPAPGEPDHIPE